jgi:hypothetical protein
MPTSAKSKNPLTNLSHPSLLQILLLVLPVILLYGQFLWNPIVFDDGPFFDGSIHGQYLGKVFDLSLRWLPYATFEWTRALLGTDLIWVHLGNLALHVANIILLFLFLRRLFEVVLPADYSSSANTLSPLWLAVFGALIFALHPAAVYAVAYLIQRSTLMATFFTLVMWSLFLKGLVQRKPFWLVASAVAYFFAVLSKEHAIMAPAVAAIIFFLVCKPNRQLLVQVFPTFLLYGLCGAFVMYQRQSGHILGLAYEPLGLDMLSRLSEMDPGFDRSLAYPLSILTQSFLFFKYLLVWIIPSPAWMSVDMYEDFAMRLWSWPHVAGLVGFVVYPIIAVRLLLRRGVNGLLGFAMLCPWLLFATELSTVRIQESFVLYRSYLWMVGAFAAMPFLFQRMPAKRAAILLTIFALIMIPLSWARLKTFSHPLLLWDDAAHLIEGKEARPGVERIYNNRGVAWTHLMHFTEAIEDYNKSIAINPEYSRAYNNRGWTYMELKQYPQALADLNKAITLSPQASRSYLGRGLVYEALGNLVAARKDFEASCLMGSPQGCQKSGAFSTGGKRPLVPMGNQGQELRLQ